MKDRKNVTLACGHVREVSGDTKVGEPIPCSEHGYALVPVANILPHTDTRPRWSDGMATTGPGGTG